MLTSHVGVRIGTVTLPGATPQLLKGVIDRVRDRQAHSIAIAQHSRIRLTLGWLQIGYSTPPLDQSGI
jgi:hypothetical protein